MAHGQGRGPSHRHLRVCRMRSASPLPRRHFFMRTRIFVKASEIPLCRLWGAIGTLQRRTGIVGYFAGRPAPPADCGTAGRAIP